MKNPLLSGIEWLDEVICGKHQHAYCQWRGGVVPTQPLGNAKYVSDLLRDSHVRTEEELAAAGKGAFPEPYTLEMNDGTLVSFMLVRGSRKNMREIDVAVKADLLGKKIAAYMSSGRGRTHSFGMYFLHDPETAAQVFEQKVAPLMATAKRLGGDATLFKTDMASRMVHGAAEEMALFTVRTHMGALRKDEIKVAQEQYRKMMGIIMATGKGVKNVPMGINSPYGQALLSKSTAILHRHEGLVGTLLEDFNSRNIGINVSLLAVREAFERVQRWADREIPQSDWMPRIFGQEGSLNSATTARGMLTPLSLGMQVLTRKIQGEVRSVETSNIGHTWYGSAVMEIGPTSPRINPSGTMFSSLMLKIKGSGIPMCISFEIFPDGLGFNRINQMLSMFLGSIGSQNRQIRSAYEELQVYQERHGATDPIVGTRIAFTTWAKGREKAEKRLLDLQLAVRAWGGAVPNSETGSPETARLSCIPEFMAESDAPVIPAPLQDVVYMSPLMRVASPWDHGQMTLKTVEGVLYPIGIGTSKHASYVTGVAAPSGSGKSFTMNKFHTCLALSPGATKLPYLCLIDVAPSGKGVLRQLRMILPKSLHHQLIYYKVINDKSACVNPFDLQLGCARPTPPEIDFLMSVFESVFENLGDETAPFVKALIDEAYKMFEPKSTTARLWQNALDERISKELKEIGFSFPPNQEITVYQVVDALFAASRIESAIVAQRYAVPRMEDLGQVIFSDQMKGRYGSARINDEAFLDKASRGLINAVEQYPLLAGVTRIDMDNARIKVIDLQSVISGASDSAHQFKGMMYLYARHLGARNFFLDLEEIRSIVRPEYKEYQEARVREIQQTVKILTYDEWHNVLGVPSLVALNVKEGRESRKFRVFLNLITQYMKDFPQEILSGFTTVIIAGQASLSQNEFTRKELDLTETDFEVLRGDLDRIGRIWVWFKLREGQVTALLDNEVGPLEAWCYTTDDKDGPLRNELEQLIGEREALLLLAKTYPTGTASSDIDKRARNMSADQSGAKMETVTSLLARELADKYNALPELG